MVQVELNNMYINIGANDGSEEVWTEKALRHLYIYYACCINRI